MSESRAYSTFSIKSIREDERVIEGIASAPSLDRQMDVLDSKGAQFKLPLPFLWQHSHDHPIGSVISATVTKAGILIRAQIAKAGLLPQIDERWALIKSGLVRGLSVGWRPLSEPTRIEGSRGLKFSSWELLEISAVTVPANIDATILSIKTSDAEAQAASGRIRASRQSPGVSGLPRNGTSMKTTSDQLALLTRTRVETVTKMEKAFANADDSGAFTEATEEEEYDQLGTELKALDKRIERLQLMEQAITGSPLRAVKGANGSEGSESRGPRVEFKTVEIPKGIRFARYAMAVAAGKGSISDTLAYAKRWDAQTPEVTMHIKAEAGTVLPTSPGWGSELAYPSITADFIELLMPETVIGKINGFVNVPFNVRILEQVSGSTIDWVGELGVKQIGELDFSEFFLGNHKMAGIVVMSNELVRLSNPSAETKVRDDLQKQVLKFMDQQFLLSSVTATANRPASVTNNVSATSASGTTAEDFYIDLNAALAQYDAADMGTDTIHIVTTPAIARGLSTLRNSLGSAFDFPQMTPMGGSILGFPVIVSNSVASGLVIFIKANEILMADDGRVTLDASNQATLDMAGGSTPVFSLWQRNATAIRAERWITYLKRRADAVAIISGAAYGPSVSP